MKEKRYKISVVTKDGRRIERRNVIATPLEIIGHMRRFAREVSAGEFDNLLYLYLNRATKRSRQYEISKEGLITRISTKKIEDHEAKLKRLISELESSPIFGKGRSVGNTGKMSKKSSISKSSHTAFRW